MGPKLTGAYSPLGISDLHGHTERKDALEAAAYRAINISADERENPAVTQGAARTSRLRVGLVDGFAFTRGCLVEALTTSGFGLAVEAFDKVSSLVTSGLRGLDVLLYYDHEQAPSGILSTATACRMQEEFAEVPVIILSDALQALTPQTLRAALKCGVRGFVSTQTFEIKTVSAAIRFVTAGGIFAPVDLLLVDETKAVPMVDDAAPPAGLLTPRQVTVLSLLQQGKANKNIAYELGMSESTVKVHIRNIMRKMGATNRTQALYKIQQLSQDRTPVDCAGI